MQAIGSNNEYYLVHVRGLEKPIKLTYTGGEKLSNYLVGSEINQFVHVKDVDGTERTIRTTTIERVEKHKPVDTKYKTIKELGLPELVTDDGRQWR